VSDVARLGALKEGIGEFLFRAIFAQSNEHYRAAALLPSDISHAVMLLIAIRFALGAGEAVIYPAANPFRRKNRVESIFRSCIALVLFCSIKVVAQAAPVYDLLLQGGHVLDDKNHVDAVMDIAIKDGKIAKVAKECRTLDILRASSPDMHDTNPVESEQH
jgi:hypothetical protein